jgi:hypothetical protein
MALSFYYGRIKVAHNVLALGEEADFEAQNCPPELDTKQKTSFNH